MSINSMEGRILRWREGRTRQVIRLISNAAAFWDAMQVRRRRRQTTGRLAALSDHTLKDLGLHRSEVGSIAHWCKTDRTRRRNIRTVGRSEG